MKNLIVIISALSIMVLYGCGTMPQTADEFRKAVPRSFSAKVETFEVNRPFRDVAKTFQKKGPDCLNKTLTSTESGATSYHVVVTAYKATVLVSEKKAELHLQERHDKGVLSIYKEPEGGHYILVVDATPLDKKKTKIDMYRPTMGNDLLINSIKGWATGENLGCPDLTKN